MISTPSNTAVHCCILVNFHFFRTCPTKLDLMCGSDGVTYTNLCNLNAVACQTGQDIEIVSNGKCRVIEAVEAEPEDGRFLGTQEKL